MIISKKKPFEEVIKSLEGKERIFVVGCGECATVTQTGGENEVAQMKALLEEAGKTVVGTMIPEATCHELDVKRLLRKNKDAADQADAFLVLSCGAGCQSVRAGTDKTVVPGVDTLFLGNIQRAMDFLEKCSLCGQCVLAEYGAICPVTRCAKGLLNGPCGGTNHGKCEVDPEKDCAWVLIHDQLKKEGRERERREIHGPKNWNVVNRPGKLAEVREKVSGAASGGEE